jgi:hypothetical protein
MYQRSLMEGVFGGWVSGLVVSRKLFAKSSFPYPSTLALKPSINYKGASTSEGNRILRFNLKPSTNNKATSAGK